ncbi:hypothetical protein BGZ99_010396 [Dissophora globulifera]|uniref:Thioredoxin domain-containing protein n=1 Tax=Dissophora globulifera TaxID=979702 RepID=A0A9P6UXI5_9FUNG|nr:hypothetical protein BGZ99_010396 [Dissophora globulifera]
MKFFKTSVALVGALALLALPATAQYSKEEEEQRASVNERRGAAGYFDLVKSFVTGGATAPALFGADPTGSIVNITDDNFRETIYEGEYIVAFCSATSVPCADYFPTFLDAATTMHKETNTVFASVWVEENPRLSARFFIPARLPYLVYAKDGEFRQIPYVRNDTQFLINFIEEEQYQYYPIMNGIMSPYSTLANWFEKYAQGIEWLSAYTAWMPYSSDPAKYAHLNPDGTKKVIEPATTNATSSAVKSSSKSLKSSSSSKKRSTKKAA